MGQVHEGDPSRCLGDRLRRIPMGHSVRGSRVLHLTALALAIGSGLTAQTPDPNNLAAERRTVVDAPVDSVPERPRMAIESRQAVEIFASDQIRTPGAVRPAGAPGLPSSLQVGGLDGERTRMILRVVSPPGTGSTVQILVDGGPIYIIIALPADLSGKTVQGSFIPVHAINGASVAQNPSDIERLKDYALQALRSAQREAGLQTALRF